MFDQETIDRLTTADVRTLGRVMEIMAKFSVPLTTVVMSVDALKPMDEWRFYPPYKDFNEALEEYNVLAEHDGYQWTPPSERKSNN